MVWSTYSSNVSGSLRCFDAMTDKCPNMAFTGATRNDGTGIEVKCGTTWAGEKQLCSDCEIMYEREYPQGWHYYPGDTCQHGVYVGGCGPDYMCGLCEDGCDTPEMFTWEIKVRFVIKDSKDERLHNVEQTAILQSTNLDGAVREALSIYRPLAYDNIAWVPKYRVVIKGEDTQWLTPARST